MSVLDELREAFPNVDWREILPKPGLPKAHRIEGPLGNGCKLVVRLNYPEPPELVTAAVEYPYGKTSMGASVLFKSPVKAVEALLERVNELEPLIEPLNNLLSNPKG